MSFPTHLKYTKDHEWVLAINDNHCTVGVTSYALEQLGDVIHVELPEVGDELEAGSSFGTIESTKTVSDLYMPISGKIVEINEEIIDNLEGISEDPYDEGWLIKVEYSSDENELDELLDANDYEDFISE